MLLVRVFRTLNKYRVKYLVAGGVAAVLYGNPRFTKALDLFVDLEEKNLQRLVKTFHFLKFIPRTPVKAEEFISSVNRRRWMKEKGMKAFTFINPKNPIENIDILIASPVSFSVAYRRKKLFEAENVRIPTVSRRDLIHMKRKAGRPQDKQDIAILKQAGRRRIK